MRACPRFHLLFALLFLNPFAPTNLPASQALFPFQYDQESQSLHLQKNFILLKGENTGLLSGLGRMEFLAAGKASAALSVWGKIDHTATIPDSVRWRETHLHFGTTLSLSSLLAKDSLDFDSLFNPITQLLGISGHFGIGDADGSGFTSHSISLGYTYMHERLFQVSINANELLSETVWETAEKHPSSLHISLVLLKPERIQLYTSTDLTFAEEGPYTFTVKGRWIPSQNASFTCGTTFGDKIIRFSGNVTVMTRTIFAGLEMDYPLGFMPISKIITGVQF
jgi:hypothetical protein